MLNAAQHQLHDQSTRRGTPGPVAEVPLSSSPLLRCTPPEPTHLVSKHGSPPASPVQTARIDPFLPGKAPLIQISEDKPISVAGAEGGSGGQNRRFSWQSQATEVPHARAVGKNGFRWQKTNESAFTDSGRNTLRSGDSGSGSGSKGLKNSIFVIAKKVSNGSAGKFGRDQVEMEMFFPDISVKESLRFVSVGSKLERLKRSGGYKCAPCKSRVMKVVEVFHANLDIEKQAMILMNDEDNHPTEVFLQEITAVRPMAITDRGWVLVGTSTTKNLSLNEFKVVTQKERFTFLAESRKHVKYWVTALQTQLNNLRRNQAGGGQIMNYVRTKFRMADINHDGRLCLDEVQKLFRSMNCFQSQGHLRDLFLDFDKDKSGSLCENEFVDLFRHMLEKPALKPYFQTYSILDDVLQERVVPFNLLSRFLEEVQGDNVDEHQVAKELKNFSEPLLTEGHDGLTEIGFYSYVCSTTNAIMNPVRAYCNQDMEQPLSRYWISTSHNTYLEGGQIAGHASVDQYLQVLESGCRCVEIDCWDGPNKEPIVTHGHTMTNHILFQQVVCALRDHGFKNSPYPLILSLEMHCSDEQVCRIGQILEETFGDMLLQHPPTGHYGEKLVSPHAARNKVLVKAKLHSAKKSGDGGDDSSAGRVTVDSNQGDFSLASLELSSEGEVEEELVECTDTTYNASASASPLVRPSVSRGSALSVATKDSDVSVAVGGPDGSSSEEKRDSAVHDFAMHEFRSTTRAAIIKRVSACAPAGIVASGTPSKFWSSSSVTSIKTQTLARGRANQIAAGIGAYNRCIYLAAKKCHNPEQIREPCNVASFEASKIPKLIKKHGSAKMKEYHQTQLTRIYPHGQNINSQNFSPLLHWAHGAQMVAMNYQTTDAGMLMHEAMFREYNGGCGYVLKPHSALHENQEVAAFMSLAITVISGHFLPKPLGEEHLENINPSVVVSIHGKDGLIQREETPTIPSQGFSPEWGSRFNFEVMSQDDVLIMTFEVLHNKIGLASRRSAGPPTRSAGAAKSSGKFVAAAAYPVKCLRSGLRWVQLFSEKRESMPNCGLLVQVQLTRDKADSNMLETTSAPQQGSMPPRMRSSSSNVSPPPSGMHTPSSQEGGAAGHFETWGAAGSMVQFPSIGSTRGDDNEQPKLLSEVRGDSQDGLVAQDLFKGLVVTSSYGNNKDYPIARLEEGPPVAPMSFMSCLSCANCGSSPPPTSVFHRVSNEELLHI